MNTETINVRSVGTGQRGGQLRSAKEEGPSLSRGVGVLPAVTRAISAVVGGRATIASELNANFSPVDISTIHPVKGIFCVAFLRKASNEGDKHRVEQTTYRMNA